jgi:hypothetical protein
VIVNLPSDVVDKLSPHETGLPISWATIIAACITVLAAFVALGGIWWQVRAAAKQSREAIAAAAKQSRESTAAAAEQSREAIAAAAEQSREAIAAAAEESRNSRVADARLARQSQLTERMAEALGLVRALEDSLTEHNRVPLNQWPSSAQRVFNQQTQQARTLCNILLVLGAEESCGALDRYIYLMNIMAKDHARESDSLDDKSYMELRDAMHATFTRDLSLPDPSKS